jgi:hypothetical protein
LLRLPALIALCVAATKSRSAPDSVQCHLDLGQVRQDSRAAQTLVAEQVPASAVAKLYDLIFDRHRYGT